MRIDDINAMADADIRKNEAEWEFRSRIINEVWDEDEHKKDRTCNHTNCREVCPECIPYIGYISDDCEAVKNWDSFVEQKNNELEVEKLASDYTLNRGISKGVEQRMIDGFVAGFNKAKESYEVTSPIRELHQYKLGLEDGYNKAKESFYTKQDLIDLVQQLKDYTKESHTILGHDDRDAIEFVDIFLDYSNYQDNE
jgi:flagellar biosynthesis/type III secretory pathway protein FliH